MTAFVSARDGKLVQTLNTGKGADGAAYDAVRHRAFVPAGGDGVLNVIGLDKGKATLLEKVATGRGARTLTLDERTGRVYVPVTQYGAAPAGGGRAAAVPGGFHILVVGPQ